MFDIYLFRYTYKAWMKCFPNSSRCDWANDQYPKDMMSFLYERWGGILSESDIDISEIRFHIVMIDDAYFEWLNRNDYRNTEEIRELYAKTITNRDARYALRKSKMNRMVSLLYLPVTIITDYTGSMRQLEIPGEITESIRNAVAETTNISDVYVGDALLSSYDIVDFEDEFYDEMLKKGSIRKWAARTMGTEPLDYLCLPVMLTRYQSNPVVDFSDENMLDFLFPARYDMSGYDGEKFETKINDMRVSLAFSPILMEPENAVIDKEVSLSHIFENATRQQEQIDRMYRVDKVFEENGEICVATMQLVNVE